MPSLHVAWAVWCILAVRALTGQRLLRAGVVLYAAIAVFVVLATANHFVVDTAAGVVTTGLAVGVSAGWSAAFARAHRTRTQRDSAARSSDPASEGSRM
jgi:hypothetical protein